MRILATGVRAFLMLFVVQGLPNINIADAPLTSPHFLAKCWWSPLFRSLLLGNADPGNLCEGSRSPDSLHAMCANVGANILTHNFWHL